MVPELLVTDFARSLRFYTDVLGFGIRFQRASPAFAYLELGEVQLMLELLENSGWITGPLETPLGRGINLQMEVAAVAPLLARLAASGVTLYREPTEQWRATSPDEEEGQIEFLVQDPDGYLLRFVEILGTRPRVTGANSIEA